MSSVKIDLIIIADRANYGRVRECCASLGPQTLERFERRPSAADYAVMKLKPPPDGTCQLAWGSSIGALRSAIEQLYAGNAEFMLWLTNGSEAHLAVQHALTELGATRIGSGDAPIN